jgi:hypothetical protein
LGYRNGGNRNIKEDETAKAQIAAEGWWTHDIWVGHFLDAIRAEAADGLAPLRWIKRSCSQARHATAGRRDSHAAAAIDLLAAAPLLSATSLANLLGIAIKNAIRLLDGFVVQGLASEVTHRSKRRLYGFTHLAPLREATTAPRRPQPVRPDAAVIETGDAAAGEPPLVPFPPLLPLERGNLISAISTSCSRGPISHPPRPECVGGTPPTGSACTIKDSERHGCAVIYQGAAPYRSALRTLP